ncbi:MAG: hypothetical protein HY294_03970 [Candidatus Rokubacteria bacterium]|nr:hypothetical protein [Candidatus Rokubacteria bacterium]MBI3825133.1 hypothetical protein [Candidatus Rokubacteria bacterium]
MADIPEFYIDQFRVGVSPWGAAMTCGLSDPHPNPGQAVPVQDLVRLRMSLEHLKVMAMILRRQLKAYEDGTGVPINIPRQVYNQLGLSSEDW